MGPPCKNLTFDVIIAPPAASPSPQCIPMKTSFSHPVMLTAEPEKPYKVRLGNFAAASEFFATSYGSRRMKRKQTEEKDFSVPALKTGPSDSFLQAVREGRGKARGKADARKLNWVKIREQARERRNREKEKAKSSELSTLGDSYQQPKSGVQSSLELSHHDDSARSINSNDESKNFTEVNDLKNIYVFGKR
ncbi:hypothetical protein DID88_008416 [Monilinia fructigena]|uniref:Uncharacterized protein n=1 Tax=Monilinia fructigena TaxID=38457 RepID=A0A395J598_9HELO|nr:hypothetical protein DID88_008416 [Monilinia fructigena]